MSQSSEGNTAPKSMRHKQILDVAAENPEASIAELAAEVPSATADLVERVLEEHGDPAETESETESEDANPAEAATTEESDETMTPTNDDPTDPDGYPAPADLSPAERETIRAIRNHPTASQRDLAETLGVTASTVSNRVNGIDGFEWSNRETFAEAVFGDDQHRSEPSAAETPRPESTAHSPAQTADTDSRSDADGATEFVASADALDDTVSTFQSTVETLSARLDEFERQVETAADGESSSEPFEDPELVHKVVHACMDSQNISEEEELRILNSLV